MSKMEWSRLLSEKRLNCRDESIDDKPYDRTEFQKDIDRIIFSSSFRRLNKKTQVHPFVQNDHIHNRLSHSIEVSRVGSALGYLVGKEIRKNVDLLQNTLPSDFSDIVQSACLAHDIGNPPIGHAGEKAIKNALSYFFELNGTFDLEQKQIEDLSYYEGNAQGFRVLTQLENHLFDGGLNLTCATLGTFLKYPWTDINYHNNKRSAYLSEKRILESVASELGLIQNSTNGCYCKHPLSYLVESADDICYGILDIEDAVEMSIIDIEEVLYLLETILPSNIYENIREQITPKDSYRIKLNRIRKILFPFLINDTVRSFMNSYDLILNGNYKGDLFSCPSKNDPEKTIIQELKEFAMKKIYTDQKKVEIELGSAFIFQVLVDTFCLAASKCLSKKIDWKSELVLKLLGDHSPASPSSIRLDGVEWNNYECLRRMIDYIGGMTDNYALYISKQIQGNCSSGGQRP